MALSLRILVLSFISAALWAVSAELPLHPKFSLFARRHDSIEVNNPTKGRPLQILPTTLPKAIRMQHPQWTRSRCAFVTSFMHARFATCAQTPMPFLREDVPLTVPNPDRSEKKPVYATQSQLLPRDRALTPWCLHRISAPAHPVHRRYVPVHPPVPLAVSLSIPVTLSRLPPRASG
jgi:hypothetical protein